MAEEPIYSGYFPFHSVELGWKQLFWCLVLDLRLQDFADMFQRFKVKLKWELIIVLEKILEYGEIQTPVL